MKRAIPFINGFVACLLLFYTGFNFILYKWARGQDICGIKFDFIRKDDYKYNRPYPSYTKYV